MFVSIRYTASYINGKRVDQFIIIDSGFTDNIVAGSYLAAICQAYEKRGYTVPQIAKQIFLAFKEIADEGSFSMNRQVEFFKQHSPILMDKYGKELRKFLFFSWIIKQTDSNINLISLLDRLELYVLNVKNKKYPDGHFCKKCQLFYPFAETNQPDETLICWSCRNKY